MKNRILSTLKFFDLQDYPLTLLELHKFLVADWETLREQMDSQGELLGQFFKSEQKSVSINQILKCLDQECIGQVENVMGFYCLPGRRQIVDTRLNNYFYGLRREKIIRRYAWILRHIPFVRGAALGGSQAMGLAKPGSDIDLFIITEENFLWLARTFVTLCFQLLGNRRYGKKIANRFCLNHYLARPKAVEKERNLYKAMEYGRLRPLVGGNKIEEFRANNLQWMKVFFPNFDMAKTTAQNPSVLQKILEAVFNTAFGRYMEKKLEVWQIARIKQGDFIFVTSEELSFHPESKHKILLQGFFEFQEQVNRKPVEAIL